MGKIAFLVLGVLTAATVYQCVGTLECDKKLDLVFVVDTYFSIGKVNFMKAKMFLKMVVSKFAVSLKRTRVGLVSFSVNSKIRFDLNDKTTKYAVKQAISRVPYGGQGHRTRTAGVLTLTSSILNPRTHRGARSFTVPKVAVLLTDGKYDKGYLKTAIWILKWTKIEVFVIGVGSGISYPQLKQIASDPDATHIFRIKSFSHLSGIVNKLSKRICSVCTKILDLAFVLDTSVSIGKRNFKKAQDFIKKVVSKFPVSLSSTRVGLVSFSVHSKIQFDLNDKKTKLAVKHAISSVPYGGTHTNIPAALHKTIYILNPVSRRGARWSVPKIAVVLTDGKSNMGNLKLAVKQLRKSKIEVFAIGVGTSVSYAQLKFIASNPDATHVFKLNHFSQLIGIMGKLYRSICSHKAIMAEDTMLDFDDKSGEEKFDVEEEDGNANEEVVEESVEENLGEEMAEEEEEEEDTDNEEIAENIVEENLGEKVAEEEEEEGGTDNEEIAETTVEENLGEEIVKSNEEGNDKEEKTVEENLGKELVAEDLESVGEDLQKN